MNHRIERFTRDVENGRKALVPGTPERYQAALVYVRILDAEAVLAALEDTPQRRADFRSSAVERTRQYGPWPRPDYDPRLDYPERYMNPDVRSV